MPKSFETIKENAVNAAANKKDPDDVQDRQHQKLKTDRLVNKKSNAELPKNNASVFSAKPEPNRGAGDDRRPNVPKNHSTRAVRTESLSPNASASDTIDDFVHSKNKMFKSDSKKQRIKRALGAFYGKKKQHNENAVMSVGSGAVAGIQDPTTNYAFQVQEKKRKKNLKDFNTMATRKKPVGEEFAAGIGNTQRPAGTKDIPGKKKLSSFKRKKNDVETNNRISSTPPSTSKGDTDTQPPIGGSSIS